MSPEGNRPSIKVRLDIEIPTDQGPQVQLPSLLHKPEHFLENSVQHPTENGTTLAKWDGSRWCICAVGNAAGNRHVFARVYSSLGTTPPQPEVHPDTLWTRPESNGSWKFDMLPIPGDLGDWQILVVWFDTGSSYQYVRLTFQVSSTTTGYTYCETYGLRAVAPIPPRRDWSRMPDRWHFQLSGCADRSCSNCACLNGDWVVTRDKAPGALRWYHALPGSFTDPGRPSFWRLTFNAKDGFWYLDCVGSLEQLPGTWISYRRHESAWDPSGPNTMHLVTDSGYCHVPDAVTLVPA